MEEIKMQDMVNYCKQYGFIFQGSEIYGGLANTWDFGPVGVELKKNIKNAWMKRFIQEDINNFQHLSCTQQYENSYQSQKEKQENK